MYLSWDHTKSETILLPRYRMMWDYKFKNISPSDKIRIYHSFIKHCYQATSLSLRCLNAFVQNISTSFT